MEPDKLSDDGGEGRILIHASMFNPIQAQELHLPFIESDENGSHFRHGPKERTRVY